MYTGNNETAIQSKKWLTSALLELMQTIPYERISIQALCSKADLSRQTFYNLFDHKEEILEYWLYTRYEDSLAKVESQKTLTLNDITFVFSDFFNNNKTILQVIIKQRLENVLSNTVSLAITDYANRIIENIKVTDKCKYVNSFLTGAITSTLICWFKDSNKLSTDELASLLNLLLSGVYYQEDAHFLFSTPSS